MRAKLSIIGAGSMGGAVLRGAIDPGVLAPGEVLVAEPDGARREAVARLGVATVEDPGEATEAEAILLAVKPQVFPAAAGRMGTLPRDTIVISIMAGLRSDSIRKALGPHARVVRVMPNTPCLVGAGMAAIARGAGAREGDEALARRIFEAVGRVVGVEESQMHAVTALSGSGPAYVFLLAESMEQAGRQMGLSPGTARTLAYQTILGAGRLLTASDDTTADALRTAVTSPGGTTAAALEVMFEQEVPQTLIEAIDAARSRGEDLARGSDR